MPYYKPIREIKPKKTRLRTLSGLKRLRAQLDQEIPRKTRDSTLVLGTWNIRNFDDNRFMNGHRSTEDLHYIAEIISRFDVLAVQEICDSIYPLEKLMDFLGKHYDYIITDVAEGRGGNDEWRTFHGSDHLPLWVELEIDFSGAYLDYLATL